MDFIKKHYEKVLLSLVLLGLVGVLVLMGFVVESDQEKFKSMTEPFFTTPKPLPELDFTQQTNLVKKLESPLNLDFSTTNKLFNPVQWQKDVNGNLIKIQTGHEIGAEAAKVTKITPLYFNISLDFVVTNELSPRYVFSVENQAAVYFAQRRVQRNYASVGEKTPSFTLKSIKGPPENPSQYILTLSDGTTATLTKDKPFQRVDGYSADLEYAPEGLKWPERRVGSELKFAGDDYNIVAIRQNEVVLSAQSNQKRTTLRYAP